MLHLPWPTSESSCIPITTGKASEAMCKTTSHSLGTGQPVWVDKRGPCHHWPSPEPSPALPSPSSSLPKPPSSKGSQSSASRGRRGPRKVIAHQQGAPVCLRASLPWSRHSASGGWKKKGTQDHGGTVTRMATPEWAHGWPQGWGLQAVKDGTAGPAMTNGTPAPHSVPLPGGVHGDQVPHWQVCLGHGRHRPCPACVLLSADLCAVDGPPLWVAPAAWPPPSCCSPALKAFEKATATLTRLLAPLPGWPAPEAWLLHSGSASPGLSARPLSRPLHLRAPLPCLPLSVHLSSICLRYGHHDGHQAWDTHTNQAGVLRATGSLTRVGQHCIPQSWVRAGSLRRGH